MLHKPNGFKVKILKALQISQYSLQDLHAKMALEAQRDPSWLNTGDQAEEPHKAEAWSQGQKGVKYQGHSARL